MTSATLPDFQQHAGHEKYFDPLPEQPAPLAAIVADTLRRAAGDRPPGEVRVLDLGCGRGDLVASLRACDWDAWGADVEPRYMANGRSLGDRLRVIQQGHLPYEDGHFDAVLSNQVLEHVSDLDGFAAEAVRVTRPGGLGLHMWPARWKPIEPHMLVPLAHWLPKGRGRDLALRLALAARLDAGYFPEHRLSERVRIYSRYSREETFYRPVREIERAFRRQGCVADTSGPTRTSMHLVHPDRPRPVVAVAAWLYRHGGGSVCLRTERAPAS